MRHFSSFTCLAVLLVSCASVEDSHLLWLPPDDGDDADVVSAIDTCRGEGVEAAEPRSSDVYGAVTQDFVFQQREQRGQDKFSECMIDNGFRDVVLSADEYAAYLEKSSPSARRAYLEERLASQP